MSVIAHSIGMVVFVSYVYNRVPSGETFLQTLAGPFVPADDIAMFTPLLVRNEPWSRCIAVIRQMPATDIERIVAEDKRRAGRFNVRWTAVSVSSRQRPVEA